MVLRRTILLPRNLALTYLALSTIFPVPFGSAAIPRGSRGRTPIAEESDFPQPNSTDVYERGEELEELISSDLIIKIKFKLKLKVIINSGRDL